MTAQIALDGSAGTRWMAVLPGTADTVKTDALSDPGGVAATAAQETETAKEDLS